MSTNANDPGTADSHGPAGDLVEDFGAGGDDAPGADEQADFEAARVADAGADEAALTDTSLDDTELAEMQVEDAIDGGLEKILQLIDETPPYRADVTDFEVKLRLYPELQNSPKIVGYMKRPPTPLEESRETLLAVTVADKGRTSDGAQRQAVSLRDDPANARMFHAICERVHCALKPGEGPRDFKLDEDLTGFDKQAGKVVTKPVREWIPGYVKSDFIYQLLDSRFRIVDASGKILDEGNETEMFFALIDQRQFYVLQEHGSLQRKDGTWTPPRHRMLYVFDEPGDKERERFKESGFYMEQHIKDRRRSEQRSVRLRIMMALFDKMADKVYGMVVGDGKDGVRPLDVRNPVDRQYIFGTWQKNALVPVFNNLMGVGGK